MKIAVTSWTDDRMWPGLRPGAPFGALLLLGLLLTSCASTGHTASTSLFPTMLEPTGATVPSAASPEDRGVTLFEQWTRKNRAASVGLAKCPDIPGLEPNARPWIEWLPDESALLVNGRWWLEPDSGQLTPLCLPIPEEPEGTRGTFSFEPSPGWTRMMLRKRDRLQVIGFDGPLAAAIPVPFWLTPEEASRRSNPKAMEDLHSFEERIGFWLSEDHWMVQQWNYVEWASMVCRVLEIPAMRWTEPAGGCLFGDSLQLELIRPGGDGLVALHASAEGWPLLSVSRYDLQRGQREVGFRSLGPGRRVPLELHFPATPSRAWLLTPCPLERIQEKTAQEHLCPEADELEDSPWRWYEWSEGSPDVRLLRVGLPPEALPAPRSGRLAWPRPEQVCVAPSGEPRQVSLEGARCYPIPTEPSQRELCEPRRVAWGDGFLTLECADFSTKPRTLRFTRGDNGPDELLVENADTSIALVDLDGREPPELYVHTGNPGPGEDAFLALGPDGLELLLYVEVDEGRLDQVRDLDGDGVPEIAGVVSLQLPAGNFRGGGELDLPFVFSRDAATGQYVDRTLSFPERLARDVDTRLEAERQHGDPCASPRNLVSGFGNAQRLGRGEEVRAWVRTNCRSEDAVKELERMATDIRTMVDNAPCVSAPPRTDARKAALRVLPLQDEDRLEECRAPQ